MLLIELNEYNTDLLKAAAKQFNLSTITSILSWPHSTTVAEEKIEHFGLDPWVQWVSIHTGKPMSQHKVEHLADAANLKTPQLWEKLGDMGVSYGIWGAMNAKFNPHPQCKFFFPDPWTYTEEAFPKPLNDFLALPRYYGKNYLKLSLLPLLKGGLKATKFLLGSTLRLLGILPLLIRCLVSSGLSTVSMFAIFDLINVISFVRYNNKYKPQFKLIFLNSIAHYQHHSWKQNNKLEKKDEYFFRLLNKSLALLLENHSEPIMFINALSQKNTAHLRQTLYRQKSPKAFFDQLKLPPHRVEQLMTNDTQLIFHNINDLKTAKETLRSVNVSGQTAFHIEAHDSASTSLFCRFTLWDTIDKNATITSKRAEDIHFYSFFEKVVERTGSHVSTGDVYARGIKLEKQLANFRLGDTIHKHFKKS